MRAADASGLPVDERPVRRVLFINSANIVAAVAVLELDTVTARLSSGSPKAADARDSKHGRDSVASRAYSALHTQTVSAKLPAGASVCGLHDEVGTAADWEMARWAAFPQLDALFWLGDKHRVQACRCSRKLLDNASSWAHPVPLRPHHCAYVGRLLSSWLGVVRP